MSFLTSWGTEGFSFGDIIHAFTKMHLLKYLYASDFNRENIFVFKDGFKVQKENRKYQILSYFAQE